MLVLFLSRYLDIIILRKRFIILRERLIIYGWMDGGVGGCVGGWLGKMIGQSQVRVSE